MGKENTNFTPTETDDTTLLAEESETAEEENAAIPEDAEEESLPEPERKILFMKAAQGYGMILGFGVGYILSGLLSEIGIPAGKFECVILCMFAGLAIGYLISNKKTDN